MPGGKFLSRMAVLLRSRGAHDIGGRSPVDNGSRK